MKPIRVYDSSLNMLTETDNYLSLQFSPKFYEVGEFELHINQYVEGAEYFVKGNLIVLDKREDKAMLIRHREIALDQNGKVTENWRVTGVTLKGVLDQRVTIPPESTSHDRKSGNAETVMKHYVDRHFVNPDDPARKIDYIEIAPDKGRGVQVEWESRFKNVADELSAISKQANLGWVMYADMERGKWVFDVIEPRDVTQGNEAGLQPVFFSPDFSTIKTQQFVDSDNNYKNVGFIGGQGEGVERKIVKIGESKGMDLREVFIDARDVSDTDEETEEELSDEEYEQLLIERGERRMREFETTFYLEAQILTPSINRNNDFAMSTPFEYETDFRLGDLVQVFNKKWNITMNAPITEFTEIHEPNGFILEAIFGEAQPTLITKIRDKFNELEGIEKQELPARLAVERMRDAMQYGDERLSEEERARIEQALEILDESKEYADEEAYQAEQEAKRHADDQDIVYDEIAKEDASEKSGQAREDAKQHAEQQDEIVRDDAAQDATDKADQAENNAKGHADQRAEEAEQNAKDYTDENAVDRGTYEDKMQEIADDLGDKAGIEYVDGQLQLKADSDVVQGIEDTVSDLQGTASDLEQAVIDHADALAEQDGRIINVETDLDTVEGNLSLVITDLSNLNDTVSQQQTAIEANTTEIGLKASQSDLDTVTGDINDLEAEFVIMAGEIASKVEETTFDSVTGELGNRLTTVEQTADGLVVDVSDVQAEVDDIETELGDIEGTLSSHSTQISANADEIALRATSDEVDTLEGRVSSAESEISTVAGEVALRATKTEVDAIAGTVDDVEAELVVMANEISSKVEDGDVRSIFTQEAGSFTFSADQINFDGHVFGQNATFNGDIVGASITGSTFTAEDGQDGRTVINDQGWFVVDGSGDTRIGINTTDQNWSQAAPSMIWFFDRNENEGHIGFQENDAGVFSILSERNLHINASQETRINSPTLQVYKGDGWEEHLKIARRGAYNAYWDVNIANGDLNFEYRGTNDDSRERLFRIRRNSGYSQVFGEIWAENIRGSEMWSNTSGNSTNTRIGHEAGNTSNARLYRVTSARKYKTYIQDVEVDPYRILNISPKSWYDRKEVENNDGSIRGLKRYYGAIADDVEEAGLHQYVTYHGNEIEELQYDRLWTLLIPISRDHEEKINWLETENKLLKERVERLERERGNK